MNADIPVSQHPGGYSTDASMRRGLWFVVSGLWFVVCGLWFVVCGLWFVVCGLWFDGCSVDLRFCVR